MTFRLPEPERTRTFMSMQRFITAIRTILTFTTVTAIS